MSERYIKSFSCEENLHAQGAPLVIRAGALLKDTEKNRSIAQLKLQNIGEAIITFAKVAVTPFDGAGNPLSDAIEFEYGDLSVAQGEEFGTKRPILLPGSSARSFKVIVVSVGFSDGSAWNNDGSEWLPSASAASVVTALENHRRALSLLGSNTIEDVEAAKALLIGLQDQKDVSGDIALCDERIAALREELYQKAIALSHGNAEEIAQASAILEQLKDVKDVSEALASCEEALTKNQNKKKKKKKIAITVTSVIAGLLAIFVLFMIFVRPILMLSDGYYDEYIRIYQIKEYEIPEGVTELRTDAFYWCKKLERVTMPDSVTEMGGATFAFCDSLIEVKLSKNLTEIPFQTFGDCKKLERIDIPEGVTTIGEHAFSGCESLKAIKLPAGLTEIGFMAFAGCDSLESIIIPAGVTTLDWDIFWGCTSLTSVTLDKSITDIGGNAFSECVNLTHIYYNGTLAEWDSVNKDTTWLGRTPMNSADGGVIISCSDGETVAYPFY